MLMPNQIMALGTMPGRLTRRNKSGLGQGKAAASPRALTQVNTQ